MDTLRRIAAVRIGLHGNAHRVASITITRGRNLSRRLVRIR